MCLSRDGAARKLVGLITRRSLVQIQLPQPNLISPITRKASCFARIVGGKYKPNTPKANVALSRQQRLWGIFVLLFEIDKNKLCNLKFVKHCSLEKAVQYE